MAIDSEDKRRSVVCIFPSADGTISGVDKQHVAGFYRGIAAASPTVIVTPSCRTASILTVDRTAIISAESRSISILVETRDISIANEDRTSIISVEDRTILVNC